MAGMLAKDLPAIKFHRRLFQAWLISISVVQVYSRGQFQGPFLGGSLKGGPTLGYSIPTSLLHILP